MASTNKTTNLLLSQFLGTDHFSFLTDYNGDMLKIDTYCGNLKALIDSASAETTKNTEGLNTANESITSLQRVQETQNTSISELQTTVSGDHETLAQTVKDVNNNTKDINTLKLGGNTRDVSNYGNVIQRVPENLADLLIIDLAPSGSVAIMSNGTDSLFNYKDSRVRYTVQVPIEQINETFRRNLTILTIMNAGTVSGTYEITIDGNVINVPWCVPLQASFQIKSGYLEISVLNIETIPTNALFNVNPVHVSLSCICAPRR